MGMSGDLRRVEAVGDAGWVAHVTADGCSGLLVAKIRNIANNDVLSQGAKDVTLNRGFLSLRRPLRQSLLGPSSLFVFMPCKSPSSQLPQLTLKGAEPLPDKSLFIWALEAKLFDVPLAILLCLRVIGTLSGPYMKAAKKGRKISSCSSWIWNRRLNIRDTVLERSKKE